MLTPLVPEQLAPAPAAAQAPPTPRPSLPLQPVPPRVPLASPKPVVSASGVTARGAVGQGVWTPPANVSLNTSYNGAVINRLSQYPSVAIDRGQLVNVLWSETVEAAGGIDGLVYWNQKPPGGSFFTVSDQIVNTRDIEPYQYRPRIVADVERTIMHGIWGTCDTVPGGTPIYYANKMVGAPAWNLPVQVHQAANCPNLTLDQQGNVHVVFETLPGQFNSRNLQYFQIPLGGFASQPEPIATDLTRSHHPFIHVSQDGTIHVAWSEELVRDDGSVNTEIYYAWRETNGVFNGGKWSGWSNLSNNDHRSDWPAMASDYRSAVTIVWHDESQCVREFYDIFSRFRFARGEWTPEANLSRFCLIEGQPPRRSMYPTIAVDVQSNVHVAFQSSILPSDYDGEIYYQVKPLDGAWGGPKNISNTPGSSRRPQIAVDTLQQPHLVWEDNTNGPYDVFYAFDAPKLGLGSSTVGFLLDSTDGSIGSQPVSIRNDGDGWMEWTATASQPWIQLATSPGDTPGATKSGLLQTTDPAPLYISVDASKAISGTVLTGQVAVNAGIAASSPQTITVSLYRGELQKTYLPLVMSAAQAGW